MKLRTLKEWNKKGRKVKKGSKAFSFNAAHEALFTKEQTQKQAQRQEVFIYDGYRGTNYNEGQYYFGGDNPDQMDYDLGLCGQM